MTRMSVLVDLADLFNLWSVLTYLICVVGRSTKFNSRAVIPFDLAKTWKALAVAADQGTNQREGQLPLMPTITYKSWHIKIC